MTTNQNLTYKHHLALGNLYLDLEFLFYLLFSSCIFEWVSLFSSPIFTVHIEMIYRSI